MNKPNPKQREPIYDYSECAKYIAWKLGIKDLHNINGKTYGDGSKESDNYPYLNWWHYISDSCSGNGCEMYLPYTGEGEVWEKEDEWAYKIAKAFNDEFGDETLYWVEW